MLLHTTIISNVHKGWPIRHEPRITHLTTLLDNTPKSRRRIRSLAASNACTNLSAEGAVDLALRKEQSAKRKPSIGQVHRVNKTP